MDFSKLDSFIDTMPRRGFPACELAATLNGELIYHRCAGYSNGEKTKCATENDLYWIYSATKVITCIAAMRLVEEGRMSLSDPVSKYIPEYKNVKIKNPDGSLTSPKGEMTVEHLFTMTGGLTYNFRTPSTEAVGIEADTLTLARAFAADPILFEPGTRFFYSLCHDVLAAVCEVIVGVPFSEYLENIIFKPLGLTDIGFRPNDEQKKRFSAMYTYNIGPATATEIPCFNELSMLKNYESGGGGLFSSVGDYLKIITAIACGGATREGYRILKPETIAMMQKNYLSDTARNDMIKSSDFGYGWGLCGRVHMDPTVSLSLSPVGEFGWNGAANAYALIDPENRLAIFYAAHVMKATYGYTVVHPTLRNMIYEQILS